MLYSKNIYSWLEKKVLPAIIIVLLLGGLMISPSGHPAQDTIPPVISNVRDFPDPVPVGEQISIDCTVTDNVAVSTVKINIFLPSSPPVNLTMARIPSTTDGFYFTSGLDEPGNYEYFIWAQDTSGNTATSARYGFTVEDITPPEITLIYPIGGEIVQGTVRVRWTASDSFDTDLDEGIAVKYSVTGGSSYQTLGSGLNNSGFYDWDTTQYLDAISYKIMVTATDDSGNTGSDFSDFLFTVDNTPPETTLKITGTLGENGWYISNVTVTLNASDATSGVNRTLYRIDNSAWVTYTGPFVIVAEGNHSFEYYSVNNGELIEDSKTSIIKVDKNPPVVSFQKPRQRYFYIFDREIMRALLQTIIIGQITVEIDVTEVGSGLERVNILVDGEVRLLDTEEPFEWLFDEPAILRHRHTLGVNASDYAGHTADVVEIDVWVFNL